MEEYIESLCEWMQSFSKDPKNKTVPQFLEQHRVSWDYLNTLMERSDRLRNEFGIMLAKLHNRWFDTMYAREYEVNRGLEKMVFRYLDVYDEHFSNNLKKPPSSRNSVATSFADKPSYKKEKYANAKLEGSFKTIWNANTAPARRSRKTKDSEDTAE